MEITSRTEGRTTGQIAAEMSCGCPAGYQLRCETPEGDVVSITDACQTTPFDVSVPDGFQFVGDLEERCSTPDGENALDFMFCERP